MFVRVLPLRLSLVLAFGVTLPASLSAQIAAKSPFMPPQTANTAGPTAGAPLEYRGFIETSSGRQIRIYDPAKKVGTWVKLNERNPEFELTAKEHDIAQKTLTVELQGKTLTLAERESKIVSSGAAGAAVPPPVLNPAQSNVAPAVTQAVVLNPTPADEQRRLDAVAAEVARRRAMREQATQQITQGAAPQTAVAPAGQPAAAGNYQQQAAPATPRTRGPQPGNSR